MKSQKRVQVGVVFEKYSKQVPSFSLIPSSVSTLAKGSRDGKIPVGTGE